MNHHAEHPSCHEPVGRWYKNKLLWVSSAAAALYSGGFLLPILRPFQHHFLEYVKMVWWALLAGLLLAGAIDRYIPPEYVSRILARRRKRTIFYATGLGLAMSACSHGILAIAIELHKKGASGPAVVSFLLGSPWANLPVTLLLVSLFHLKGILIIASALFVAITTGLIFQVLDRLGWIERNPNTLSLDPNFSILRDLKERWGKLRRLPLPHPPPSRGGGEGEGGITLKGEITGILRSAWNLADMILWWILLGITLAGLIGAYVPPSIFQNYLGPTFTGLLLTLAAATVIEVCSEGSAPLAFEVYRQTGSIGNTFAFLMGGFVTDYTEVGLVWTRIGWRTAIWMVGITVPLVILLGWLYNLFFS